MMNCDEILSEITGHPTGQAFSYVDEFCNPRLMTFDEVLNVMRLGKIEFRMKIMLSSIKKIQQITQSYDFLKQFSYYENFKSYAEFGIDEKSPIEVIFDSECIIENPHAKNQIIFSKPIEKKFLLNEFHKNVHICICPNTIYVSPTYIDIEIYICYIKKNDEIYGIPLFSMDKDNDIVKFYDIGA
jgi:hypothetical protein